MIARSIQECMEPQADNPQLALPGLQDVRQGRQGVSPPIDVAASRPEVNLLAYRA